MSGATIISLAERRPKPQPALDPHVAAAYVTAIQHHFAPMAVRLAEIAAPIVEPFRRKEPDLEQHLKGAFLRWQVDRVRRTLAGDPNETIALGVALAITVEAFTDRLLELQHGIQPPGGDAA